MLIMRMLPRAYQPGLVNISQCSSFQAGTIPGKGQRLAVAAMAGVHLLHFERDRRRVGSRDGSGNLGADAEGLVAAAAGQLHEERVGVAIDDLCAPPRVLVHHRDRILQRLPRGLHAQGPLACCWGMAVRVHATATPDPGHIIAWSNCMASEHSGAMHGWKGFVNPGGCLRDREAFSGALAVVMRGCL